MKKWLVVIISFLIIPQVTLAAWWNPFKWTLPSKKPSQTQILENRIKELETKLNTATTTPITPKVSPAKSTQTENKQQSKTVAVPEQVPVVVAPVINNDELYKDLVRKYNNLKEVVTNEMRGIDLSNALPIEVNRYKYLRELRRDISEDIEDLKTLSKVNPKPISSLNSYLNKIDQTAGFYNSGLKGYSMERDQEVLNSAKMKTVDYIKEHKTTLSQATVHIEAARLLYIFDKIANTHYATDFETKKTSTETIEFANRFLIDQGQ